MLSNYLVHVLAQYVQHLQYLSLLRGWKGLLRSWMLRGSEFQRVRSVSMFRLLKTTRGSRILKGGLYRRFHINKFNKIYMIINCHYLNVETTPPSLLRYSVFLRSRSIVCQAQIPPTLWLACNCWLYSLSQRESLQSSW